MLTIFAIGFSLHGITLAMHAVGATYWIDHLIKRYSDHDGHWREGSKVWTFMSTGAVLLVLHLFEALAWAVAFFLLPGNTDLKNFEDAVYFSLVTFTTLGYGDMVLDERWRILSGAEAVNGILLAGWSTALLFSVVQRSWRLSHSRTKSH
jgi:voltage-gated potassium channel